MYPSSPISLPITQNVAYQTPADSGAEPRPGTSNGRPLLIQAGPRCHSRVSTRRRLPAPTTPALLKISNSPSGTSVSIVLSSMYKPTSWKLHFFRRMSRCGPLPPYRQVPSTPQRLCGRQPQNCHLIVKAQKFSPGPHGPKLTGSDIVSLTSPPHPPKTPYYKKDENVQKDNSHLKDNINFPRHFSRHAPIRAWAGPIPQRHHAPGAVCCEKHALGNSPSLRAFCRGAPKRPGIISST